MTAEHIALRRDGPRQLQGIRGFLQSLEEIRAESNEPIWFRGHDDAAKYDLVPSIGRVQRYAGFEKAFDVREEQALLHRFRRRAYPFVNRILNDWDAMFLARHHGLPTRLLDWSANPLVALFFACTHKVKRRADLWAIQQLPESKACELDVLAAACATNEQSSPFTYYEQEAYQDDEPADGILTRQAVKLVHPFYNSPRLSAQDGIFTFHTNPRMSLLGYANREVRFQRDRLDVARLIQWRIEADQKPLIARELHLMGVNDRTVFPDLDGLARDLWETEVLWKGSPRERSPRGPSCQQ